MGKWKDGINDDEKKADKHTSTNWIKSHEEGVFADYIKEHTDKVDDQDIKQRKFMVVQHTNEIKKWFKITPSARAKIWNFKPEFSRDAYRQLVKTDKKSS